MKTLSYVNATGSVNLASEVYTYNLNLNRDVSSVFGPCRACGWSFWKRPRTVQTPPRPPRRGLSYTLNQVSLKEDGTTYVSILYGVTAKKCPAHFTQAIVDLLNYELMVMPAE